MSLVTTFSRADEQNGGGMVAEKTSVTDTIPGPGPNLHTHLLHNVIQRAFDLGEVCLVDANAW